ncbi:hypothetical protein OXYTRIMIC_203 [Oxytricha trifallax]|uniref:HMG box domain-containing protein n=1 Tax=Oxytricha trifallax TaxID=1172189 RepID=A0A073HXU6_9SPIT|nr:hypothetical protein OXYTRIMIC_203 [Oxytricha trifallax]
MKTADIMKRVEQKEYFKEINKKERLVSPYHRFVKKTMPELKLQDPGKEFYQYMSIIAKKWSEMTKEQKLEYDDKETQLKAKQFQNHKTQDQIFEELKQKEETYQLNMHYQKEQESVTVDGFVLYAEEQRKKIKLQNPKIKINELMEQIKSQWEGMNDQEKRQYNYTADRFKQSIRNKKS